MKEKTPEQNYRENYDKIDWKNAKEEAEKGDRGFNEELFKSLRNQVSRALKNAKEESTQGTSMVERAGGGPEDTKEAVDAGDEMKNGISAATKELGEKMPEFKDKENTEKKVDEVIQDFTDLEGNSGLDLVKTKDLEETYGMDEKVAEKYLSLAREKTGSTLTAMPEEGRLKTAVEISNEKFGIKPHKKAEAPIKTFSEMVKSENKKVVTGIAKSLHEAEQQKKKTTILSNPKAESGKVSLEELKDKAETGRQTLERPKAPETPIKPTPMEEKQEEAKETIKIPPMSPENTKKVEGLSGKAKRFLSSIYARFIGNPMDKAMLVINKILFIDDYTKREGKELAEKKKSEEKKSEFENEIAKEIKLMEDAEKKYGKIDPRDKAKIENLIAKQKIKAADSVRDAELHSIQAKIEKNRKEEHETEQEQILKKVMDRIDVQLKPRQEEFEALKKRQEKLNKHITAFRNTTSERQKKLNTLIADAEQNPLLKYTLKEKIAQAEKALKKSSSLLAKATKESEKIPPKMAPLSDSIGYWSKKRAEFSKFEFKKPAKKTS